MQTILNAKRVPMKVPFTKSSHSSCGNGNCVEVGVTAEGNFAVRDSKDASGPALALTRRDLAGLAAFAKSHAPA